MHLLLKNLRWVNVNREFSGDVRIANGIITEIGSDLQPHKNERVGNFENHYIYPGLINSHDHLEMNLYPKLGTPPYANYLDWAKDIYKPNTSPIREIEKVDIKDRLLWGGLKNLISGVTTVVHHNPWHIMLRKKEFPTKVLKTNWAHSPELGKDIQKEFKKNELTFVIHAGEGIDEFAYSEITKLHSLGLLKKNTVLVHAVAARQSDIESIASEKSSMVWCPASNLFMFDQTAPIQQMKGKIKIAIGTDSTMTGTRTLLDEIKIANETGLATSNEIYDMITAIARTIFNLPDQSISITHPADLFIAPIKHKNYFENLIQLTPEDINLILINGNIKLVAAEWQGLTPLKNNVKINSTLKYIDVDVAALKQRIEKKVGATILEANALWRLIEV